MADFVIPLNINDLRSRTSVNQYVVDEVFPVRLLPAKIQECRSSFRTKGPLAILDNFDNIYSVLKRFHEIAPELKEDTWDVLVKALSAHANQLVELLEHPDLNQQLKQQHCNAAKMTTYLLCQYTDILETEATKPTNVAPKGRKKTARASHDESGIMDWDAEKERAMRALLQLLNLNIHRLWDPPVVEEEFINVVSATCYKLLENVNINKDRTTRETIFRLLGVMIKKYNHSLSCTLKMIQLLQHFEHLAAPLAHAVQLFSSEYGAKNIAGEIMREIGRMDPKDLSRDTSGTRAYAAFLVELSSLVPQVMLPYISVLTGMLDGESYSMRNSVLGVLGEMLVRVLSKDTCDDKEKRTREQFLDKLEDHIHDVHAFCRSKTLQIWLMIVNEKCLPMARQGTLLEIIIGRLHDKSSQVRKYGIQLVTALLKNNPFAAKLPIEELQDNYEKEKEKLEKLMPDPQPTPQEMARKEAETAFDAILRDLKKAVQKYVADDEDSEEDEKADSEKGSDDSEDENSMGGKRDWTTIADDDTPELIQKQIYTFLSSEKYKEATGLLCAALDAYPSNPLFGPTDNQSQPIEEEDMNTSQRLDKAADYIYRFKIIFVGNQLHEKLANSSAGADLNQSMADQTVIVNELSKQQVLVQYLKDSLDFINKLQRAIPVICQLLGSKNQTDVLEAIEFFVTGFEFGVANTMSGIRSMLALIWSKEQGVKDSVVEAYKRLYMRPDGSNARANAIAVANNLTALTFGATLGDVTSMEQLICEFVTSGELNQRTIQVLWERFAMKIPNTTEAESRGALQLLAMAAIAEVEIVRSNIDVLVKEGLGPRAENDFLLAKEVCSALVKLAGSKKKKAGEYEEPYRFPEENEMFERLAVILVNGVDKLMYNHWVPLAEQAVNVIYKLAEHPDRICGKVIKEIAKKVMTFTDETSQEKDSTGGSPTSNADNDATSKTEPSEDNLLTSTSQTANSSQPSSQNLSSCPSGLLTRLLALAGHVAFRQLVHIDCSVFGELKRRRNLQEKEQTEKKTKQDKDKANSSRRKSTKVEKVEPTDEEEMGLGGGAAEDAESEFIRKVTETEIVTGNNMLGMLRPLIVNVCTNGAHYTDPQLRAAASLALAKYMLVSSEFCENHLQLLFTVIEKSPHSLIRANIIVALGDLTFRFPNLIEPWTPNLYARLRDPSPQVRKNTVMVLTHLILNDMVKVKGQISELATCITDDDIRISGLSKLFFNELAKKGNAIYNIMPDMVSRLSDPEIGVEEANFRLIMKYLFSFIQKDRQSESLVEKLCHRFRATKTERQARDLAFCLSMLSYNEKSVRKLQENFACFADKLHDEEVFNCFMTITNGAKKFAKPEAKTAVEEFEALLNKVHEKGVEDEEVAQNANKAIKAAKAARRSSGWKRGPRTPRNQAPRTRNPLLTKEEQEEDDEVFQHKKKKPGAGGKAKPRLTFSSDEESEMDFFEQTKVEPKQENHGSDNENTPGSPASTTSSVASPDHLQPSRKTRHKSSKTASGAGKKSKAKATMRRGNLR